MNIKTIIALTCFNVLSGIFVLMYFVNKSEGKEVSIGILISAAIMTFYSFYRWWFLERKSKNIEDWVKKALIRSTTDFLTANVILGGFGSMIIYLIIFDPMQDVGVAGKIFLFLLALICVAAPVFYGAGYFKNKKTPSLYDVLMGKTNDSILWTIETRVVAHAKNVIPVSKFQFHLKNGGTLHLMVDPPYLEQIYGLLSKHNPQMKFGNTPENKEWYNTMCAGVINP